MSDLFSPFRPSIFLAVVFSFPVFYILGAFFTPRLSTPWRNVSARAAMGALVFTALMALAHAGWHTMLLPFVLFLPFLFTRQPKDVLTDLKAIPISQWLVVIGLSLGVLIFEMSWADLRVGNDLVVGNWDYANSGGFGFEFYKSGKAETSRFLYQNELHRGFHHFADAWFAGFYSYYLGLLPYYSYVIVYRVVFHLLLILLLMGYMSSSILKGRLWLVFFIAIYIFMYAGLHYTAPFSSIEKMGLTSIEDTFFNFPTILVLAVSVLLFYVIILEEYYFIGLIGLGLVSVWHPSVSLIMPIMLIGLLGMKIPTGLKTNMVRYIPLSYTRLFIAMLFSLSPYIYSHLDGRNYAIDPNKLFTYSFLSVALSQMLLTTISLLFFIPMLHGLYGWAKTTLPPFFVSIQIALLSSSIFVFSLVFSHLGGDSIQIWAIYVLAFLTPIGSIGLFITTSNRNMLVRNGAFVLLVISMIAMYNRYSEVSNQKGLKGFMRYNLGQDEEWESRSQIRQAEAIKWHEYFSKRNIVDIGIVVSDSCMFKYRESIFMAHLPYLRAFLPGAEFHRLNIIPLDTFEGNGDLPRLTFFKRSSLSNCYQKSQNEESVVLCMIDKLKPSYLLLDTLFMDYNIPPYLANTYNHFDTLGRFVLVSKEKK